MANPTLWSASRRVAFGAALGLLLASACTQVSDSSSCVVDADCSAAAVCSGGLCVLTARSTGRGASGAGNSANSSGSSSSGGGAASGASSTGSAAAGGSSGSGSSSGGNGTSSTATTGSTTPSTTGSAGNGGSYAGEILLEAVPYIEALQSYTAYAYFYPGTLITAGCAGGQQSGSCCFQSSNGGPGGGSGGAIQPLGAGPIQMNGGSLGTLAFAPGSGYAEESSNSSPALQWNPGDTLSVSAPGDSVGAFSGSVVAPGLFSGLDPPLDSPTVTKVPIPSGEDFTLDWAPGGGSNVTLLFSDSSGAALTCSALDSAGTLTVPAAQLARLASGPGALALTRLTNVTVSADNAQILLQASTEEVVSATLGGGCGPLGWTCQSNGDCCGQNCSNGVCGCGEVNAGCTDSSDCCAGTCTYNVDLGAEVCNPRPTGSACAQDSDCGSSTCSGGVCACATTGPGSTCFTNVDCCSNFCGAPGAEGACIISQQGGPCGSSADCYGSTFTCSFDTECTACGADDKCCLAPGSECSISFDYCCSGSCAATDGYPDDPTCQ